MTTTADTPNTARARLVTNGDERVVLTFADTDYQTHLRVLKPLAQEEGKRVRGTIRATARRIDQVGTGGRYIEPVYGRPTRIAGVITTIDAEAGTVTVDVGVPFVIRVSAPQRSTDFETGAFVTMNLMPDASFSPAV